MKDDEEDTFAYDNPFRRVNDGTFSKGVHSLFDYLSHWAEKARPISLSVVLQAEKIYGSGKYIEPGTCGPWSVEGELIAPYRASFVQGCQLPIVSCISSLTFPGARLPGGLSIKNRLSPGAALKIASACGGDTLSIVEIDGTYLIPRVDDEMLSERWETTAENFRYLPPNVHTLSLLWSAYPDPYDIPYPSAILPTTVRRQPDALFAALHKVSLQLEELHIWELDVLPEFFCPTASGLPPNHYWAHLQILQLYHLRFYTPFGDELRFRNEYTLEPIIVKSCFDEFYTSVGLAVHRMPKLKHMSISFHMEHQVLEFELHKRGRSLRLLLGTSHEFSQKAMRAWKLREGQLRPDSYGEWLVAEYEIWPPTEDVVARGGLENCNEL